MYFYLKTPKHNFNVTIDATVSKRKKKQIKAIATITAIATAAGVAAHVVMENAN